MVKVVLIVDDEPANIDLLKGLMPEGVKVKAALSGIIAVKQLSKSLTDIVFLDLMMPQMDGFETLSKIRELPGGENLPVVIVSGNASDRDIAQGKALGAIGHLQKPVDGIQLMTIIDEYLKD